MTPRRSPILLEEDALPGLWYSIEEQTGLAQEHTFPQTSMHVQMLG